MSADEFDKELEAAKAAAERFRERYQETTGLEAPPPTVQEVVSREVPKAAPRRGCKRCSGPVEAGLWCPPCLELENEEWRAKQPRRPCEMKCGAEVISPASICEPCSSKLELRSRMDAIGRALPAHFRWCSWDAPELPARVRIPAAIKAAQASVQEAHVVLSGPAGAGKTSLAACMFRSWLDVNWGRGRGVFEFAHRLAGARMRAELGHEVPLVERAMRAKLLVIDDLGSEAPILSQSEVRDVLFERYAEDMATWVTTAMTPQAMAERYGDGIARRVFEGARIIDCGGKGR